jgi:Tol biopolymer transport system component
MSGKWITKLVFIALLTYSQTTTRISVSSSGTETDRSSNAPSISADGRFVAFESGATNLVTGDSNLFCGPYGGVNCVDVFVHDRQTGQTELVSISSSDVQANNDSDNPYISGDGRFVAFSSLADNLVQGDTNNAQDVFVHDRTTGQTRRVSVASDGTQSNGNSGEGLYYSGGLSISGDGRYVAFASHASNLVAGDTNGKADVFVHDLLTGETRRVSVASDGVQSNADSEGAAISADGRYVAFVSSSIFLVRPDTNGEEDVFVHDLLTGETSMVSLAPDGSQANDRSYSADISGDGRYVAFYSDATNLVSNRTGHLFVRDRQTGAYFNIPLSEYEYAISANGRFVVFNSTSPLLGGGDPDYLRDAFVYDLQTNWITRVSVASDGTHGNGAVSEYDSLAISADGLIVAFASAASNMVPDDSNGTADIFVNQRSLMIPYRFYLPFIHKLYAVP